MKKKGKIKLRFTTSDLKRKHKKKIYIRHSIKEKGREGETISYKLKKIKTKFLGTSSIKMKILSQ